MTKKFKVLKRLPYEVLVFRVGEIITVNSPVLVVHMATGELRFLVAKLVQLGYLEEIEN